MSNGANLQQKSRIQLPQLDLSQKYAPLCLVFCLLHLYLLYLFCIRHVTGGSPALQWLQLACPKNCQPCLFLLFFRKVQGWNVIFCWNNNNWSEKKLQNCSVQTSVSHTIHPLYEIILFLCFSACCSNMEVTSSNFLVWLKLDWMLGLKKLQAQLFCKLKIDKQVAYLVKAHFKRTSYYPKQGCPNPVLRGHCPTWLSIIPFLAAVISRLRCVQLIRKHKVKGVWKRSRKVNLEV